MSTDGRLVRALVACYPARWRRRYGAEYAQLLCDLGVQRRPPLILNSLLGAVRAHGGVVMSKPDSMTGAVWAAGLFTVAGLGFAKLTEEFPRDAVGLYWLLVAGATVALLAVVAAAAPTGLALLRGGHRGVWWYLAVPFVGVAAWFGVLRIALAISAGHTIHSAPTVAGLTLIAGAGLAVVAATAWAATTVLSRVPTGSPTSLRSVALTAAPVGMAVATVAAIAWGLTVRADNPAAFSGDNGILATPFEFSWVAVVVAFAAATAVAARATPRWRAP